MRFESVQDTPPAIVRYYSNKKCPICKSKLPPEELFTLLNEDIREYISYSRCNQFGHIYDLNVSYILGKRVEINSEEIEIHGNDYGFKIINDYVDNATHITIFNPDENSNPDDHKNQTIKNQHPFDFQKYNEKKFFNLIKMLTIFG